MEFCIIELPKFERYKEKIEDETLNLWMKFIKNPEVVDMEKATEEIKKAKEVLEEISQDEHEIYLAELREKHIMDQKAIEGAGYDKGLKAGIEQNTIDIAKKMKKENIDLQTISKITGLDIKEVEKLN